jgi:hypothetical protein
LEDWLSTTDKITPTFEKVEYSGPVWCLTVPLGNFLVRRNGKCHFTGNCWSGGSKSISDYQENQERILKAFDANKIHYLDRDGTYKKDGLAVTGASGWYHIRPNSNDWLWMPSHIEGDTHLWLQKRSVEILERNLAQLDAGDTVRIFLSHFPVQDCTSHDWSERLGDAVAEQYGIDYFVSGHSHGILTGPKHFRTATQYSKPTFGILEVPL